jgi:hypothetical protein
MPKEVRLNDKMWFGKYKDKTIKRIIDSDFRFLETLVEKGKITFHKNVHDYINGDRPKARLRDDPRRWWEEPTPPPIPNDYGWDNPPPPTPQTYSISEVDRAYIEQRIREMGMNTNENDQVSAPTIGVPVGESWIDGTWSDGSTPTERSKKKIEEAYKKLSAVKFKNAIYI